MRRRIWEDLEEQDEEGLGCPSKEAYGNAVLSSIEFPADAATPLHTEGKVRAFWMQTDR